MIRLNYPNSKRLNRFKNKVENLPYSYPQVGASTSQFPSGFNHDFNSIFLGKGSTIWENAKVALRQWQQFPASWTAIYPNTTPLETNKVVIVAFRLFGLWWFNSARIVYTFEEPDRYGFAYGTLTKHVEIGEECFWIERNAAGEVYYHIKAFSRPNYWYVRLIKPIARFFQKRFVQASFETMKRLSNNPKSNNHAFKK